MSVTDSARVRALSLLIDCDTANNEPAAWSMGRDAWLEIMSDRDATALLTIDHNPPEHARYWRFMGLPVFLHGNGDAITLEARTDKRAPMHTAGI